MAADAGSRLEYVHARVAVGELDEFPDINIEFSAQERQLVRESDVHVAESVFG